MRVATGIDIIDITKIQSTINDPAQLQKMLHPGDISRSEPDHIAGRIALKEAAIKALGLSPNSWLSVRIHTTDNGKPVLTLNKPGSNLICLDGSISHHGNTAVAFVVALFDDKDEQKIV